MSIFSPLQEEVTMGRDLQMVKVGNEEILPHSETQFP